MLKKTLGAVVAVVLVLAVVLAIVVATRPARFRVERSLVIQESPRALYNVVADFHRWERWSPWAKLDPAMKTTIEGAPGQVGSTYHWVGNDKVGEGRMTILEARQPRQLKLRLEFLAPWKSTSETDFGFFAEASGTRVVWVMSGQLDFMGKAMSLFMDMDKAVGPDFERGLAGIRKLADDDALGQ